MGRVVVVGSVNTDLVVRVPRLPEPGETVAGGSFLTAGGGKGANQAVAAARMGAEVTFIGAVGSDAFSADRVADLLADGIDVRLLERRAGLAGGVALIEVDAAGQNSIVVASGANATVTPGAAERGVRAAAHPGDVLACQFELPLETTGTALRAARAAGAYSVLNAAPFLAEGAALIERPDALIVNEIEAAQILGGPPVAVADAPAAAARLAERGPSVVVITLGEHGAYLHAPDAAVLLSAPEVTVVDTTGAGDAFVGAFAALIAEGASTADAARVGVVAGSLAVQRRGAQPSLPTRDAVDRLLGAR